MTILWVKTSIILGKLCQIYFLQHIKNKIIISFVKFVATKNGLAKKDFSHLSFVAVFGSGMAKNQDPGSGINIPDPQHWYKLS